MNFPNISKFPIQQVPAVLLGKLAIDRKYIGSNLGENLIKFAIGICDAVKDLIGCRLLIIEVENKEIKLLKYFLKRGFELIRHTNQFHYVMLDLIEY